MLNREGALAGVTAVRKALEKLASGEPNNVDVSRCIEYLKDAEAFLEAETAAIRAFSEHVLDLKE